MASGAAIVAGAIGAGLLWSALNNKALLGTVQKVIKGQNPGSGPSSGTSSVTAFAPSSELPGGTAGGGTPEANKALGLLMAAAYGWSGPGEWPYLKSGWEEESGWNQFAANNPADPYNHAYGIPQANPGTKMASAGGAWKTSPAVQIRWGLKYIKDEYGAPSRVPGWTPGGPGSGYVGY